MEALILDIGKNEMLLGQDWLTEHNPVIDWRNRKVALSCCPPQCKVKEPEVTVKKTQEEPERDNDGVLTGVMPEYVKAFKHLFEKKNFDKLPKRREWDHEINLIPDAQEEIPVTWSKQFSPEEMKILDEFLDEELKTSKIWPSKSPYAAACFFIFKKGNKLRRLVQDY